MCKVLQLRNQWARLAGVPISEPRDLQQDIKQNDRAKGDARAQQPDRLSHSAIGQGASRRWRFWPRWRAVFDRLDLEALSAYPGALFKKHDLD